MREATADLQSNKDLEAVLDSELDMLVSQGFAEVHVLVSISNEQEEPENSAIRYCDKRAQKIASGLQWWEASATHAAVRTMCTINPTMRGLAHEYGIDAVADRHLKLLQTHQALCQNGDIGVVDRYLGAPQGLSRDFEVHPLIGFRPSSGWFSYHIKAIVTLDEGSIHRALPWLEHKDMEMRNRAWAGLAKLSDMCLKQLDVVFVARRCARDGGGMEAEYIMRRLSAMHHVLDPGALHCVILDLGARLQDESDLECPGIILSGLKAVGALDPTSLVCQASVVVACLRMACQHLTEAIYPKHLSSLVIKQRARLNACKTFGSIHEVIKIDLSKGELSIGPVIEEALATLRLLPAEELRMHSEPVMACIHEMCILRQHIQCISDAMLKDTFCLHAIVRHALSLHWLFCVCCGPRIFAYTQRA